MAKRNLESKELYPGEIAGFFSAVKKLSEKDLPKRLDWGISNTRTVERRVASGSKVTYKNIGVFRG
jgi:hypothetical protein